VSCQTLAESVLTEPGAEDLIRSNHRLLKLADEARQESRGRTLQSSIDRIQRCLSDTRRPTAWAMVMAHWTAGVGNLPASLASGRPVRTALNVAYLSRLSRL
jgi:hypothetical protein